MSAGPDMTVPMIALAAFVGTTALGIGGAAWASRGNGRHADWAGSLVFSTGAIGGGALLIAEVGLRVLLSSFAIVVRPQPFQLTAWIYFFWSLLLGPGLLFAAFFRRAKRTPARIHALQLVQLVAWLLSCPFTLFVGMAAGA